jgi:hypothetical protein
MFSILGGIFKAPPPRQTENADTRQNIQRHDPDAQRRKRSKSKDEDMTESHLTGATVSVAALQEFLINFLNAQKKQKPQKNHSSQVLNNINTEYTAPKTDQSVYTAKAASAYQTTANSTQKSTILIQTTDDGPAGPSFEINVDETRAIVGLIDDLELLVKADIEFISIERADTFVQSLQNAVASIKAGLA